MGPEDRAHNGLFLAFFNIRWKFRCQQRRRILKTAVNQIREARGKKELDAMEFLKIDSHKLKTVDMDEKFPPIG
ncbi:MAG: hypothetical protein R3C26_26925 [Calditrichia bacterium]